MALYGPDTIVRDQPDLREYLTVLRARRRTFAITLLLVVLTALAYSFTRTPVYESEARVQARPVALSSTDPLGTSLNMETEKILARSINVARLASEDLELTGPPEQLTDDLVVSVEPNTEILVFTYSAIEPSTAQQRAQAFADAYVADRQRQAADDVDSLAAPIEARLDRVLADQTELEAQLDAATDEDEQARLQSEISALISRATILQQDLEDLNAPDELDVGQVVIPAELPESPSSPNHIMTLVMALLVGTVLGIAAAFLQERLDDSLRGRIDLEAFSGVPVLAVVPLVKTWKKKSKKPLLAARDEPESPAAEAYRTLRTGVLFDAASKNNTKVVMIVSPEAGEGKTTTAANLSVSLAQAGKRVIILSADLRRPRLQDFFEGDVSRGLTNVLVGQQRLSDVTQKVSGVGTLSVVHSGPVPRNPAELLGSQQMRSLMHELRNEADFVVIDAAPVLAVTDSLTLADHVDAVIVVADARTTKRTAIAQSREHLDRVQARVIGTVLNNFDPSKARGYHSYGAYHGYVDDDEQPAARLLHRRS